MNLSPNMLAALRFFAGNVSEQTQTADKLLNTTVNALWRRGLLAVDTDGIIIPNEAGFAALAAVETTEQNTNQGLDSESLTVGQISDELWAKISPNFYAQVRAGEQAAAEEARHSNMDAGIQSQGCESTDTSTVLGTEALPQGVTQEMLDTYLNEGKRKNGKQLTSRREALLVLQAAVASNLIPTHNAPDVVHRSDQLTVDQALPPLAERIPQEKPSLVQTPTHSVSKCSLQPSAFRSLTRRFFLAMAAGPAEFRALWRR